MTQVLHPITAKIVAMLGAAERIALEQAELRASAEMVLVLPATEAEAVAVELIALAKRIFAVGMTEAAEQCVVLAGLALGDASGMQATAPAKEATPAYKMTPPKEGAVGGGPLARANLGKLVDEPAAASAATDEGEAKCPFHHGAGAPKRKLF